MIMKRWISFVFIFQINQFFLFIDSFSLKRKFIDIPGSNIVNQNDQSQHCHGQSPLVFRVLQYNILADGLSALRSDLGRLSRASKEILDWNYRKEKLLHEIVQYQPDVITLQECDHYYDFFYPELKKLGSYLNVVMTKIIKINLSYNLYIDSFCRL
jgi:mRNA deadenylase 3'-5' endonuclease subunit Ccr4